jgi:nucleotidyltransferase/DNA polymerase involved in DNA repair
MGQDKHRAIMHLDADAFFVGCELASNPALQGQIVAVGGSKKGIIASASYEARKLGIYTPMPTSQAMKICPILTVVPPDFSKYADYSHRMFKLVRTFTPLVEIGSIDEGYADLSGIGKACPRDTALLLKLEISRQLGLSVSIGLASNKFVASVASKLHKPDNFLEVTTGDEQEFLAPLDVKWLPGVGMKTAEHLYAAGFHQISEVAAAPLEELGAVIGSGAEQLRNFARGLDPRQVDPDPEPAQSYGLQESFEENQSNQHQIQLTLRGMADTLMERVRADGCAVRCVEVRIRYADRQQKQCRESLPEPTQLETDTYKVIDRLLARAWSRRVPLRLAGLTFSQIQKNGPYTQADLDLEGIKSRARLTLAQTMDKIKKRFGREALIRGHRLVSHRKNR